MEPQTAQFAFYTYGIAHRTSGEETLVSTTQGRRRTAKPLHVQFVMQKQFDATLQLVAATHLSQ